MHLKNELLNFKVVAVSDQHCGIFNPRGLNIKKVKEWYDENGTLEGCPRAIEITNKELLELKVDILIPGAIENQITEENASNIRASIIAEGANEAITPDAQDILADKKIVVIPGISANVGGVVVSYFEWRRNRGDRKHAVDFTEEKRWVTKELTKIMNNVIRNVYYKSKKLNSSLPIAAHILAMEIIRDLLRKKHSYVD